MIISDGLEAQGRDTSTLVHSYTYAVLAYYGSAVLNSYTAVGTSTGTPVGTVTP